MSVEMALKIKQMDNVTIVRELKAMTSELAHRLAEQPLDVAVDVQDAALEDLRLEAGVMIGYIEPITASWREKNGY